MTAAVLTNGLGLKSVGDAALKAAARLWFLVAVIGQWTFVYYIAALYAGLTIQGHFERGARMITL